MKAKPSKLDQFAEKLDEWELKKFTLDQIAGELHERGCDVSCSRLSNYLASRREVRLQERLLGQIASGARQCKEVEEEFAKNPAPGLEAIARLHRLLAFQLATNGVANPELLELSTKCTKVVLDYGKLRSKEAEQALNEKKFQRDTCELFLKWTEDERAKAIAAGAQSNGEKIQQLGKLMFGEDF